VVATIARHDFARAGLKVHVDSAGTASYHIGRSADSRSLASAASAGYDASAHRARQIEASDFERFDAVLAMDHSNLQTLKLRCPPNRAHKVDLFLRFAGVEGEEEVPDPYYGGGDDFRRVIVLAQLGVKNLLLRQRDIA
jgi:protein-tyrosine phosphatase